MKKIKFLIAIVVGKLTSIGLKIIKKKIPYYPGYMALKVCPDFLKSVKKPKTIVAITGTNGKSTISALLTEFYKNNGYKTMNNNGFNIETGITAMFLKNMTMFGNLKSDIAIIEVDEKNTGNIFKSIKPDYLICTNLFRDSMRTNGNIDYIINKIKQGVPTETKLILNADDLILCQIVKQHQTIYYGISSHKDDKPAVNNLVCDLVYCPKCGNKLNFSDIKYHHIGNVKCNLCDYTNPKKNYEGTVKEKLEIKHDEKTEKYSIISNSIFNLYNELAVISFLREMKFSPDVIENTLSQIKITDSRYTEEYINGIKIITHMAKGQNPVACSTVFEYVKKQPGKKVVLLMLDDVTDKRYSSETIAWHYDTDYEFLNDENISQIIVGGVRSKDLLIRLLLAGINENKITIVRDEYKMYEKIQMDNINSIYLLHDINACDQSVEVKHQIMDYIKEKTK